ncbi:hypothetical protein [Corynebacterium glutamicum]|uniref:hypothetical protein n=1 Tax=Corynebacterium glutamicum TaxID=1718 RepID=UPI0014653A67|nr:hypothetical protein [Corynebacterium glutamicum]GFK19273.1 hypothetical protein KbCgl_18450 [Corynebacterium glutamicum]
MSARKNIKPEVVVNDVEDNFEDSVETIEKPSNEVETVPFDVVLYNGASVTLDVIKDQRFWSYEAVEAMSEMNYPVLVNSIITKTSKFKLKAAGAMVIDFEMITEKVSETLGMIKKESE